MPQEVVTLANAVTLVDYTLPLNFTINQTVKVPATDKYTYVKAVFSIVALTGTAPTLQADMIWVLADGTQIDIYNNGTHTNTWTYDIGPGCAANLLVPPLMAFNIIPGGTIATVNLRVAVVGYY